MENQANLITSTDDSDNIKAPWTEDYVKIFRIPGTLPTDTGTYWGKRKDGGIEPIGGSTPVSLKQLSAEITQNGINPTGLIAYPFGGVGPYQYGWRVKSIHLGGLANLTFNGPTNMQTVQMHPSLNSFSLVECKVEDSNGQITFAYFTIDGISVT